MNRPTILDLDLVVVPREAAEDIDATIKEFGHWHHLNEMTIAKGMVPSDSEIDIEVMAFNKIKRAMLSASPYPTAWDEVRKAYDALEEELKWLRDNSVLIAVFNSAADRAEAAEACILSALTPAPDLAAWDDVRKYVEGLEKEVERLKDELGDPDGVIAHANSITELSEARIAELEKRLADAEREPVGQDADGILRQAIQRAENVCKAEGGYMPALATLVRILADDLADAYPDDTNGGRAARAYMEETE